MTRKNRLRDKVRPFAEHMAAVGDIHRMSILYLLSDGPLDAWQLAEYTGISPSLISHHVKKLFEAGWVKKTKYGKKVEYRLNPSAFFVLQKLFQDTPEGREAFNTKRGLEV